MTMRGQGKAGKQQPSLNLEVGATLYLTPENGGYENELQVSLLGYLPGQSLIVSTLANQHISLDENTSYNVRTAHGDTVTNFRTKILRVCREPYPYYHLQYPEVVQDAMLRRTQRLPINSPAVVLNMHNGTQAMPVAMVDISMHGARLVADDTLGKVGDKFFVDLQVGEHYGKITFPFVIRYIYQNPNEDGALAFHHGVEFSELDQNAVNFVARFIKDNVAQQRNNKPPLRVVK